MLLLLLLIASLAGTVAAFWGILAYKRAHDRVAAGDLAAARAAYQTARRFTWLGFLVLAVAIPAALFVTGGHVGVPRAHIVFLAMAPILVLTAFMAGLLVVDLRLQDRLRATPPALAASGFDESITFELTADHLWRSQLQWQIRSTLGRITLALCLVAILGVLIGFPLLIHSTHPQRPLYVDFIPTTIALLVVLPLTLIFGKKLLVATAGGRPGILCAHTIEVRADGLREKTDVNDTLWPWTDLRELIETRQYLLLRVSSIGLFAVPKSAFSSEEQLRRFVTAIRHRMSAPGAAVPTPA